MARVAPAWAGTARYVREGMAPAVGFEPTTKRLTAARSTTELRRSEGRERSGIADGVHVTGAGVGAARQDSTGVRSDPRPGSGSNGACRQAAAGARRFLARR